MEDGGSKGEGNPEVENGPHASEVTSIHNAGALEVEDVVREREMRIHHSRKLM